MNEELKTVDVREFIDEAAFWFMDGSPGREVDEDYTKPFYWGLEDEEKRAISYIDFHFAVLERVDQLNRTVGKYKPSYG